MELLKQLYKIISKSSKEDKIKSFLLESLMGPPLSTKTDL